MGAAINAAPAKSAQNRFVLEYINDSGAGRHIGSVESLRAQGFTKAAIDAALGKASMPITFDTGGGEQTSNESIGLYRDDGLGLTRRHGRGGYVIEKELHRVFKEMGLKLTTEVNLKKCDFLDLLLDLDSGTTSVYRKPNDNPKYINKNYVR